MTASDLRLSFARRLPRPQATEAPSKWVVFGIVSVGTFMTTLDASIVNIAMPSIAHAFGTPVSGSIEWVVIGYLVVIAATLLWFSRLADIAGRHRVWVAGLAVFTIGSAFSGLAPTLIILILARALQGIGASLIFAPALALVVDAFPRNQRGQALGLNAVIVSLGVTVGPTLGGLITETLGWRFIFFVNVPLGLIGMVVAARVFAFSRGAARSRGFDLAGAATLGLGLASLSLGLSFGSEWGWTSPKLLLTLAVALVALAAGVAIELRRPNPLVEIRLLASRRMGLPLLSFLLSIFALFAVGFLLPFYFEQLRGWTPLVSGLMLSPYSVAFAITAPIAGRLADRSELPWLGPAGLALAAVGLALLARIGVSTSPLEIAVWLAISGVGQGMFLSPNTRAIMSSVPADQSGIPSGLIATTRVIGQGLSVAVAGAVFIGLGGATAGVTLAAGGATTVVSDPSLDAAFLTAIHGALLVCALLAALGAVASVGRRLPEPTDALSNPGAQRASTSQRNEA